MNINLHEASCFASYKNTLDAMPVRRFTVKELQKVQKSRTRRKASVILTLFCLLLTVSFTFFGLPSFHEPFTVTVYASNRESATLTNRLTQFKFSPVPHYTVYTPGTDSGTVNLHLFFHVEGENIEAITISCSENPISKNSVHQAPAYFVENSTMDTADYKPVAAQIKEEESFLSSLEGPEETFITRFVGNSYTVKYKDQGNTPYGLVLRTRKGDNDSFAITDTILDVDIRYTDGKLAHRKIQIEATEDIYKGLQIRIK